MQSPPNVLLLVVDSLRYDIIFGEWTSETPTIDRLANEGLRCSQCISQGVSTAPAMTALLTGRYPLSYSGHWGLADDEPTVAWGFKEGGYDTAAVHSNPYVSAARNFDRGFDRFIEDVTTFEPDRTLASRSDRIYRVANRIGRVVRKRPYTPAEKTTTLVIDEIDRMDAPWFAWGQYMDAHGPYLSSRNPSYREKLQAERLWRKAAVTAPGEITSAEHEELADAYRREVEAVDAAIGDLCDALEARGLLEETVVVVTADHGEEFGEHGRYGHGNQPYEELVRVPLVIRAPGADLPSRYARQVRLIDLGPTLFDLAGCDSPEALRSRFTGDTIREEGERDIAVTEKRYRETESYHVAFRTPRWKFIHDTRKGTTRLFDLGDDPGERTDVIDREVEVCDRFETRLDLRRPLIEETIQGKSGRVPDPAIESRLKALGYRE